MSQRIKEAIIMAASFYQITIKPECLVMYCEDLEDLPEDQVYEAYKAYRRDPTHRTFPLPAQIREIIQPKADLRKLAIDLANGIDAAIQKFGRSWSQGYFHSYYEGDRSCPIYYYLGKDQTYWSFQEAVESVLGSEGWEYIEARGGWAQVCISGQSMEQGVFIAQIRDHISAHLEHKQKGIKLTEVQIEAPKKSSGDLVKIGW